MKQFDVAVLGSTGFTGRLVCRHIVQRYHGKGQFTWAMAGRSKAKMQEIKTWLAEDGQNLADVQLVQADVGDQASLDALAASSSVVITAVGPYALYGRPVVKACVEHQAHYCDITGEPQYMRNTMDEFDAAAKAKGVRIVHACGFDSVPTEVMTLQAAHYMSVNHNMLLGEVTGFLMDSSGGGVGGGTIESGINLSRDLVKGDKTAWRAVSHPYSLIPNFDDKEALKQLPDKARFEWIRKKLPAPGDGPENVLDDNYFKFTSWALSDGSSGGSTQQAPVRLKSTFADMKRSGGYWSTSRMILECAMCMIPENEKLLASDPYASACPSGVLAPSAAFGLVLHDRLKNAEFTLEVEEVPLESKKAV